MAREVKLPQMGQTMTEGTIVNALVKQGDHVNKGDILFEVETDKTTIEMESPAEGFVKKILVEVGTTVAVNTTILILGEQNEQISDSFVTAPAPQAASGPAASASSTAPAAAAQGDRAFSTPRARTVADTLGVDIRTVKPAAGALRITEADVRRASSSSDASAGKAAGTAAMPSVPPSIHKLGQKIPVNRLQKIVAQKMLLSKQQIPCFYLTSRVDVTELVKLRTKINKKADVKVSYNDFIIKAVALGLAHYPIMTGQLAGDFIQLASRIDIGLAISTAEGLIAPIIPDVGNRSLLDIARCGKELIERTRTGKLALEDLEGGCITISNLGAFGIDSFIPIVVPGQTTIMGVGMISNACVPADGNIMVRKVVNLTLSVDHKVVNGADAAQFLDFVKKILENPACFE